MNTDLTIALLLTFRDSGRLSSLFVDNGGDC